MLGRAASWWPWPWLGHPRVREILGVVEGGPPFSLPGDLWGEVTRHKGVGSSCGTSGPRSTSPGTLPRPSKMLRDGFPTLIEASVLGREGATTRVVGAINECVPRARAASSISPTLSRLIS